MDTSTAQGIVDAMSDAWNRGDADQFTARFADDGTFTNIYGMTFVSRQAFLDRLIGAFPAIPRQHHLDGSTQRAARAARCRHR